MKIKILFLSLIFVFSANAQNQWYQDDEFGFKISVPTSYQSNVLTEGNDKIYAFLSHDQNVSVRVRTFGIDNNTSVDMIKNAFEQNVISGANFLGIQDYQLNNTSGKISAYRWNYNNTGVVVAAYITTGNNMGYIVWTMMPENLYNQRVGESDEITNTFSIYTPIQKMHQPITVKTPFAIARFELGESLHGDFNVVENKTTFDTNVNKIFAVFDYTGSTDAKQILVKWISENYNQVLDDYYMDTPNSDGGSGKAFVSNSGNEWPEGDYRVEIWFNGNKYTEKMFYIKKKVVVQQHQPIVHNSKYNLRIENVPPAGISFKMPSSFVRTKLVPGQTVWSKSDNNANNWMNLVIQVIERGKNGYLDFEEGLIDMLSQIDNDPNMTRGKQKRMKLDGMESLSYEYTIKVSNGIAKNYTIGLDSPQNLIYISYVASEANIADAENLIREVENSIVKIGNHGSKNNNNNNNLKTNNNIQNQNSTNPNKRHIALKASKNIVSMKKKADPGYKKYSDYKKIQFEVPENWKKTSDSYLITWIHPDPDGGLIMLRENFYKSYDEFVKKQTENKREGDYGETMICGIKAFYSQSFMTLGMNNNVKVRYDYVLLEIGESNYLITFYAKDENFHKLIEPGLHLLNTLVHWKYQ